MKPSRLIRNSNLLFILYLLAYAGALPSYAQEITGKMQTSGSNGFKDGIYLNAVDFNQRKPTITVEQIQNGNLKNKTIKTWFKSDSLFYISDAGVKTSLPVEKIWGYYEGNTLYIQRNGFAHKVHVLGNLSLFNESYPVIKAPFNPVAVDESKDVKLRMLDLQTGHIIDYTLKNLVFFLQHNDEELAKEYLALGSTKIRRQLMIKYIDLFNERHPLKQAGAL